MKTRILLLLGCAVFVPTTTWADVKPHTICSEGMVLQQKSYARIWGTADPGEKVKVTFRDSLATMEANAQGRWVVAVPTGDAGGPFELTIEGKNAIKYKNILVGEVWVCSGQSNMEWKVGGCDATDKDYAKSASANPMLRIFHVSRSPQTEPQTETAGPTKKTPNFGRWIEAEPNTVLDFSAAAYFFGRALQESRKVPVGLVHSSWGGTRIEAWMSESALAPFEKAKSDAKPGNPNGASQLYNGMIHPILNYNVKGAIWYQGESNAGAAFKYRSQQPALIENWRADFKNPNLAFHIVQLAPFNAIPKKPGESNWAELREAQTMTLSKLKNTGMAVITDFGDEGDIHPAPKRPVGERLALAARAVTYGEKIVYSGPMYKAVKFDNKRAVVTFDHVGGGLVGKEFEAFPSRNPKAAKSLQMHRVKAGSDTPKLTGFAICGDDKVFHEADAQILGNTVSVTSTMVANPIAVRFGWANHPTCNLFNREGLPASPFRTDSFPVTTQPKK